MIDGKELAKVVSRLRAQRTDDAFVEVKACSRGLSADVWETVSAFANTAGGLLLLGLDENDGAFAPAQHFDINRVRDQFVTGMGDGGQPCLVAQPPRYEMSRGEVDGSSVLLVEIAELSAQQKPCYIVARGVQAGSYKRIDDKDIRLSASEMYEMQTVLVPSDADVSVVPEATLEDLDDELVDSILANRNRQSPRVLKGAATREQQLDRVNILNKQGGVRMGGLLAAGVYPQQYFPKLVIDVAVHPGTEKAQPGLPRFLDRQVCDGPIAECVEGALNAIGRNIRKASYVVGVARLEEWEIPQSVLREALVNAVVHREYSPMFAGEAVSVDIYPNRIEVTNPGGLWGGKTLETLADGSSRCRNARLMSLMGAASLRHGAGYLVESQGSGIITMLREMEEHGLDAPIFVAKSDSFKVIFKRQEMQVSAKPCEPAGASGFPQVCKERNRGQTQRAQMDVDVQADMEIDSCEAMRPRELRQQIVASMSDGETRGARELASMMGVSLPKIRYALARLVDEGELVPTAATTNRNRKYKKVEV
ncbi:ATP-binding protein [Collinsella tanakaei]|nr:ATP-binding protein [Collinsella tanakaei]